MVSFSHRSLRYVPVMVSVRLIQPNSESFICLLQWNLLYRACDCRKSMRGDELVAATVFGFFSWAGLRPWRRLREM
jgi:hypothetical protein